MRVFLETERLILRPFTEHDADNLFELESDPEVMRFIDGGGPTPREVIERDLLADGRWAAVDKATGEFWPEYIDGAEHGDVEYELLSANWAASIQAR